MELRSGKIYDNVLKSKWDEFFEEVNNLFDKIIRDCGSRISEGRTICKIRFIYNDGGFTTATAKYCRFCENCQMCH